MDHSTDPDSPSYIPPYTNQPRSSGTPHLLLSSSPNTFWPSDRAEVKFFISGVTTAIVTLPLHYLQSVSVHAIPLGQQKDGFHRISISIGNPLRFPGLRMFVRSYTFNWIARQGVRVWTYSMLSHMMTYGSGAGDWRTRGEGREEGLATNPIVIAAMAGFASGVVDAIVEEQMTIGVVMRATYRAKESATDSAGKTGSSVAKATSTQPAKQIEKKKANSTDEKAGWRKNQTKPPQPTSLRSTYTPAPRQKASSSNIHPYAPKQPPSSTITKDFLDFGSVQRLQARMNTIEGGVKWSIMSAFQVWDCRSWLNGGGSGGLIEEEKGSWPPPVEIAFLYNAGAGAVGEVAAMQLRSLFPDVKNTELLLPWRWRLLGRVVRGALVGGSLLTVQDAMIGRTMKDFEMP